MTDVVALTSKAIAGTRAGPHLLVTGGVHGDEFEPMAAARRLARELDAGDVSGRVTLIPVVNEPAFRAGARTAEDGLDLARVCPGRPDGSVTERIADALSRHIRSADFYVDLHTGGTAMEIVPLAGYTLHRDPAVLDAQRRMARAFNLPLVWGTTAALDGRSLSVARDAGVPAIYVEHGGGGGCDPAKVNDLVAGCLGVMEELGMLRHERPTSRVRHVVEDEGEQSGHLQLNHPSPADGFFEPAVRLGACVEAGRPIGTVTDILGESVEAVSASVSGLVAVLRSFSGVKRGDALATVIPVPAGKGATA